MGLEAVKAVFDTNILIDFLNGVQQAAIELDRYRDPLISRITWIEVLAGARAADEEREIRDLLRLFTVQELDARVAEEALTVRRDYWLRLPDAIILATARALGCILVTRNTRDFDPTWPEIREPYRL